MAIELYVYSKLYTCVNSLSYNKLAIHNVYIYTNADNSMCVKVQLQECIATVIQIKTLVCDGPLASYI